MKNLPDIISEIETRLDEKDEVRELALKSSRTIARLAGSSLHRLHRGEDSKVDLREAQEEALKLRSLLEGHPEMYHSGFVEAALQEVVEAAVVHAIFAAKSLPVLYAAKESLRASLETAEIGRASCRERV